MPKSADEFIADMTEGVKTIRRDGKLDQLDPLMYAPPHELKSLIKKLAAYHKKATPTAKERRDAGYAMEQLVLLAFMGLHGWESVKSYSSPGPQYDLYITGSGKKWFTLCEVLHLRRSRRGIVVEAKATKGVVGDKTFARLCAVIRDNLKDIVSLGVFVTLSGASGFPENGVRQSSLRRSRLRQVLFHSRYGTPVVVFTWEDIKDLDRPGSLPRILRRQIEDISELSGLERKPCIVAQDVDLPPHLLTLYNKLCARKAKGGVHKASPKLKPLAKPRSRATATSASVVRSRR
jgi:hypothetical protein